MDIVVTGRHAQVTDRFREHLEDKLAKVPQLLPKVSRVDVVVTHEQTAHDSESVEITCHAKGPVIRAESCSHDKYVALDQALDKLYERLRRVGDRRRVSRGRRAPVSVARATGRLDGDAMPSAPTSNGVDGGPDGEFDDTPIEVREKVHSSSPMSLSDALSQMELVGHDFFLFHDVDTDRPSVVYRRRGWSYGVLHLEVEGAEGLDDVREPEPVAALR